MSDAQELDAADLLLGDGAAGPAWLASARARLAGAPDPDGAARLAASLLEAPIADGRRVVDWIATAAPDRGDALSRILYGLTAIAPFLSTHFRRHPEWLQALLEDDLDRPRDADEGRRLLAEALDGAADPAAVLRRHKYRELGRITVRDADPEWVPLEASAVTLREVSELADVLLERALDAAMAEVAAQLGPARWPTTSGGRAELGFAVLGLGKLGSSELNYSSDVDLVYIHASPPEPLDLAAEPVSDTARLAPADYFMRVAQAFGRIVTPVTVDGFLYRIDLDLRPEGAQGALVTSEEALSSYYESWADTWERAAFMKARPVAGDLELGWAAIRRLDPMIYQSTMDFGAVESIRSLKSKVEDVHGTSSAGWNVKIDAGGIRDVEFVAQALQLLHGGRIPQVRERSTQRAIDSLADVGLLPRGDADLLLAGYRFLRRTENRIQMEGEKQRHVVPADDGERLRLARAMGFASETTAAFDAALEAARDDVRSIVERTFGGDLLDQIREMLLRNAPQLALQPGMKQMIEDLAGNLARSIDAVPETERALNNLDRFLQGVGTRRFYHELLLDRPEIVDRLTALFSASRFLSTYLASHPTLIEPVFADPNVLLLDRSQLEADFAATRDGLEDSAEGLLAALRIFQHRQMLNVGLLDLAGKVERPEIEAALTEIAEVCLEAGLAHAEEQLEHSRDGVPDAARRGSYLVVGMGKLGSRELSYGSDLDVIFLYDLAPEDREANAFAQHYFVRLTQRLISALQTATNEGSCYEIDARLRPSGNQGTLVTSLEGFARYHAESGAVWERQALLRARAVAGSPALAARFEEQRLEILRRPLPDDAVAEVDGIRQRMETELAQETSEKRNFKTGRGGLLDVETIAQLVLLTNANADPAFLEPVRLETQLDLIETAGLLPADDVATLRTGWEFLQQLSRRLRILENRSISDLDSERGDLESLARHVGYEATGREGGARRALLRDYRRHTESIRAVYERFVGRGSAS